jgi:hypothetical protein
MKRDQRYRHNVTAIARKVGNDVVILDMASGTYFGLDPIGSRIWELIGEQLTIMEVCEIMLAEFDVTEERLNADVDALLKELLAQKLLVEFPTRGCLEAGQTADKI